MSIDYRKSVLNIFVNKLDISNEICNDIEIGIYNWTINFCDQNKIAKTWVNKKFTNIYLAKSRSVLANLLKDSYVSNSRLLDRLNEKEFLPSTLPNMQQDHIFPEIWKDTIDDYIKKTEHAYIEKQVAMSDQIKCGKCHKREVTYIEKQCRSADEPMSLLCTCIVCGNRWRIG